LSLYFDPSLHFNLAYSTRRICNETTTFDLFLVLFLGSQRHFSAVANPECSRHVGRNLDVTPGHLQRPNDPETGWRKGQWRRQRTAWRNSHRGNGQGKGYYTQIHNQVSG